MHSFQAEIGNLYPRRFYVTKIVKEEYSEMEL